MKPYRFIRHSPGHYRVYRREDNSFLGWVWKLDEGWWCDESKTGCVGNLGGPYRKRIHAARILFRRQA